MIQAVIWDMDGVLLDSEDYYIPLELEILSRYGINISAHKLQKYFGLRQDQYFVAIGKDYGKKLPIDEILTYYNEKLDEYYTSSIKLTKGAAETLSILQEYFPQALATSCVKRLALKALTRLKIEDFFPVKIYGDELRKSKPDPEIFIRARQKLGIKPEGCIVVEDSLNGFKAAKRAGMNLIGYKTNHNKTQDFRLCDVVVTELDQISTIIKNF